MPAWLTNSAVQQRFTCVHYAGVKGVSVVASEGQLLDASLDVLPHESTRGFARCIVSGYTANRFSDKADCSSRTSVRSEALPPLPSADNRAR